MGGVFYFHELNGKAQIEDSIFTKNSAEAVLSLNRKILSDKKENIYILKFKGRRSFHIYQGEFRF